MAKNERLQKIFDLFCLINKRKLNVFLRKPNENWGSIIKDFFGKINVQGVRFLMFLKRW